MTFAIDNGLSDFPDGSGVHNLPAMQEMQVQSQDQEVGNDNPLQ